MYLSIFRSPLFSIFFFFNDTATTEIYTLSLHDALPICARGGDRDGQRPGADDRRQDEVAQRRDVDDVDERSEEHTSELQSPCNLVCRLLLEKKKKIRVLQYLYVLTVHHSKRSMSADNTQ